MSTLTHGACTTSAEDEKVEESAYAQGWDHLEWGLWLSVNLGRANEYGGDPDYLHIDGYDNQDHTEARVQCSSFFKHLLRIAYGYTPSDLRQWFDTDGPTARIFHRTIAQGKGFTPIVDAHAIESGDVLAIEYPEGVVSTGHVMIATGEVEPFGLIDDPMVSKTFTTVLLEVVDAARTPHGSVDTRVELAKNGGGIGIGKILLYIDRTQHNRIIGYRWHPALVSTYYPLGTVQNGNRALAVGRLDGSVKASGRAFVAAL